MKFAGKFGTIRECHEFYGVKTREPHRVNPCYSLPILLGLADSIENQTLALTSQRAPKKSSKAHAVLGAS
jgi:hypothetical protein